MVKWENKPIQCLRKIKKTACKICSLKFSIILKQIAADMLLKTSMTMLNLWTLFTNLK